MRYLAVTVVMVLLLLGALWLARAASRGCMDDRPECRRDRVPTVESP